MSNLVGIGNSQVPTNAMLGGLAYQDSIEPQTITKMWIGSAGSGGSGQFEGTIKRIAYYPKLLTDNQLNTLTA